MYFIENNKGITLPIDNSNNIDINNVKRVFIILNNKQVGFYRNGDIFIDNYTFKLNQNVNNYSMNFIKSKTMKHDMITNSDTINSYNIGYELECSNEKYTYILYVSDQIILYASRNVNGNFEEKYMKM